jgi:hypothetical protein
MQGACGPFFFFGCSGESRRSNKEERGMKRTLTIMAMAAAVALTGCGGGSDESGGGVTEEESAGLNNAADMLDASPDSLVASEEMPLGNGEEPIVANGAEATAEAGNAADAEDAAAQ